MKSCLLLVKSAFRPRSILTPIQEELFFEKPSNLTFTFIYKRTHSTYANLYSNSSNTKSQSPSKSMSLIDPIIPMASSQHLDSSQSEILIDELKERLSNTKHKFVVCVEGNIGCGKTTLLNYFKKTKNVEILAEPVDKWRNIDGHNALELMYKDPHRWGMTLQTYVQLTMLQAHTKVQECPVKLMERSLYSAKYCFVENLYKSGKMADIDFIVLTEWFNWIIQTQNVKVDLFVYLRTDPEVLFSRIKQRRREEEMGIPLEYLKDLHQLHEDWFIHKKIGTTKDVEVLVIDANSSLEDMEIAYEKHREKILPFISSSSLPVEALEGLDQ